MNSRDNKINKTSLRWNSDDDEKLLVLIRQINPFVKQLKKKKGDHWDTIADQFNLYYKSQYPDKIGVYIKGEGCRNHWYKLLADYKIWLKQYDGASGVVQIELKHQRLLADIVDRMESDKENAQKEKDDQTQKKLELKEGGEYLRSCATKRMRKEVVTIESSDPLYDEYPSSSNPSTKKKSVSTLLFVSAARESIQYKQQAVVRSILRDFDQQLKSNELLGDPLASMPPPTEKEIRALLKEAYSKYPGYVSQMNDLKKIPFFYVPEVDVEHIPKIKYSEFLKHAKSSDIILFSGEAGASRMIRRFTVSPFSHVGMVYKDPESGEKYLFHSTSAANYDVRRGVATNGTQLNDISYVIQYGSPVIWRPVAAKDHEVNRINLRYLWSTLEMNNLIDQWSGNYFPPLYKLVYNYVRGVIGWSKSGDPNVRFCSDLVTSTMVRQGLLSQNLITWSVSPADLSSERTKLDEFRFETQFLGEYMIVPDEQE